MCLFLIRNEWRKSLGKAIHQLINLFHFRYFSTEYLASYRSLTATYYPEYAASAHAAAGYIGNGYFDVASPRSLTSIPYDAASQFNRYFESDKVDCKYNPNSESPKTEFQQQPNPQHPNSGKQDNTNLNPNNSSNDNLGTGASVNNVVKTEPVAVNFAPVSVLGAADGGDGTSGGEGVADATADVVVDLQQFVTTTIAPPTVVPTITATQLILVRSRCSLVVH